METTKKYQTINGTSFNSRTPLDLCEVLSGPALLDHCILKIRSKKTGLVLWQAPNYIKPVVEIRETLGMNEYTHETYFNGELYGRHKSLKSAQICLSKLV